MEDIDYKVINVHLDFSKIVTDYIKEFKKVYGIEISSTKATKIIADKINAIGGLVV